MKFGKQLEVALKIILAIKPSHISLAQPFSKWPLFSKQDLRVEATKDSDLRICVWPVTILMWLVILKIIPERFFALGHIHNIRGVYRKIFCDGGAGVTYCGVGEHAYFLQFDHLQHSQLSRQVLTKAIKEFLAMTFRFDECLSMHLTPTFTAHDSFWSVPVLMFQGRVLKL